MTPRPGSEQVRRGLVQAAMGQLADEGMRGLTHRRVEERAGVSQGTVKYHYGSLEGLIEAVLRHMVVVEMDAVMQIPPEVVQEAIATGEAAPTTVVIERDGAPMTLTIEPIMLERPVIGSDGQPVIENGRTLTQVVPYVGIAPAVGLERRSLTDVPPYIGSMISQIGGVIVRLPQELWNLTADFVEGEERDPTSIVGIIGVANVAGQITGATIEGYSGIEKSADLINLLIALNVSLFAFNMLPLLPLDGGHIAGALFEGARRSWATLRSKPDPGPADTARLMPLIYAVAMAFIGMTVILVVIDIFNPVTLY